MNKDKEDVYTTLKKNEAASESTLSGWFDVIRRSGLDQKKKAKEMQQKLLARKHIVIPETNADFETWLWRGEDCVVSATVRKGIIDIFSIRQYSFEFIIGLNTAQKLH